MDFSHDQRGQSVVIGTVLVFGFLIIALSLYQAQVVPQQNAQVEFEHYEAVQNDLVDLRAGIATAGQADTPQFKTVRLGTAYPTRLFGINPPNPSGSIQTSEPYEIRISNATTTRTISTRFIQYTPRYNQLRSAPLWHDTSVNYVDERARGGGFAVIEGQNLVTDSGIVRVTAVQNEFRRSGTGRVTLEVYPTTAASTDPFPTGDLTIELPTRLTGPEYWDDAGLPDDTYLEVEEQARGPGVHELRLETTSEELRVNTVGIQTEPTEGTVQHNIGSRSGDDGNDDAGDQDDPSGPPLDFRELEEGSDGDLEFTARNIAGEQVTVTRFRVDATPLTNNPGLNNEDDPEVEIEPQDSGQEGFANRIGPGQGGNRYDADGTSYPLDQSAIINDREDVEIGIWGIREPGGGSAGTRLQFELVQIADEADADVIVTLEFSDGSDQAFYFEDIS